MKYFSKSFWGILGLVLISISSLNAEITGTTTQKSINVGDVKIRSFTVKYKFDHFFGELTRTAVYKWEGTGDLRTYDWSAQLVDKTGKYAVGVGGQLVGVSWGGGTLGKPGKGYGFDVAGSPNWNKAFFTFRKGDPYRTPVRWLTKDEAVKVYKDGFKLNNLWLRKVNGQKVKYRMSK